MDFCFYLSLKALATLAFKSSLPPGTYRGRFNL